MTASDIIEVLVIDDEIEIAEFVADVVELSDYRVRHVSNPAEFVNALVTGLKLVVLDLLMPRVSGPELFAAIAALTPQPEVILMSGETVVQIDEATVLAQAKGLTVIGTLSKPFFAADLESLLLKSRLGQSA